MHTRHSAAVSQAVTHGETWGCLLVLGHLHACRPAPWQSTSGLRQEGTGAASLPIYPDQKKWGHFSASTESVTGPGLQVKHAAAFDERQNRHQLYLHSIRGSGW